MLPELALGAQDVPRWHRVTQRTVETDDTVTLALAPVDGRPTVWEPGQFQMLWMPGVGEVPVSISGAGDDGSVLHTVRSVGCVTRALCRLETRQVVGVRGPFGTGWGLDAATGRDVVLVGGGLGLAPLRGAMRQLLHGRDRVGRVAFVAGARTPDALLYRAELEHWRDRPDAQVEVTVDFATAGWRGDVGVVTRLLPRLAFSPDECVALVCGPEAMMRYAAAVLCGLGVAEDRIKVSLERTMHCALGSCGHCQLGGLFVCHEGPVVAWDRAAPLLGVRQR